MHNAQAPYTARDGQASRTSRICDDPGRRAECSDLRPMSYREIAIERARATTWTLLLALAACANDPAEPQVDCPTSGRYMPLDTGRSWTYRVTTSNGSQTKTQAVGPLEDVGGAKAGTLAYRVTTTKASGMVVSWQEDTGTAIVRHREQDLAGGGQTDELYWPHHTRLDEDPLHLAPRATWPETFDEVAVDLATMQSTTVTKTETWTVEADAEGVAVPAGDFCALRVRRTSTLGSSKTYWFARGVGKIKEQTSAGDSEELASFTQ